MPKTKTRILHKAIEMVSLEESALKWASTMAIEQESAFLEEGESEWMNAARLMAEWSA